MAKRGFLERHRIRRNAIRKDLLCFGLPDSASSLYGLLIMSALIPVLLYRIRLEERLLIEEFGDAYRTYQQRTNKLIPFIYRSDQIDPVTFANFGADRHDPISVNLRSSAS